MLGLMQLSLGLPYFLKEAENHTFHINSGRLQIIETQQHGPVSQCNPERS